MKDILHSVYIKHDTAFKSLTKRALAQIILKVVFQHGKKGLSTNNLRDKIHSITGMKFTVSDIMDAVTRLKDEKKLTIKNGRHYIKHSHLSIINRAVQESEELHGNVLEYWFSKSKAYTEQKGKDVIRDWFENLLIEFFKEYSRDWINDLKSSKRLGSKKMPNIERIVDSSFRRTTILKEDYEWLKKQFISFIESERKEDGTLLWVYGSSMFSSTLLTARNYADDFGLEIFKNSDFILDTNILMILELEGFDLSYAIKSIEASFQKLNITPKYFHISKQEYLRAIGPKQDATIASLEKYDFEIIKESDCAFVRTAIRRQCVEVDDFKRFFQEISTPPEKFGELLPLICEDYKELNNAIEAGENNDTIKKDINRIYNGRTRRHKRERPKQHDAGLLAGASFIKKTKKCWILTRDGTLREYAFEKAFRDDNPIAIGLDSLIQMLAINSGGVELSSTEFAPLFSRLVKASLMPERDTFEMEDLYFIDKTRIQISELDNDKIIEVAKKVNRLRLKGTSDDDIVLEIQRMFQGSVSDISAEVEGLKAEKDQLSREKERKEKESKNLEEKLLNTEIENRIKKLRKTVVFNWVHLLLFPFVVFLSFVFLVFFSSIPNNPWTVAIVAVLGSIVATMVISYFKKWKWKLRITNRDRIEIREDACTYIAELKNRRQ